MTFGRSRLFVDRPRALGIHDSTYFGVLSFKLRDMILKIFDTVELGDKELFGRLKNVP